MNSDNIDEEYFSHFGKSLTNKQKCILKGTVSYQRFRLSKAYEEFIESLKSLWMFRCLYNILYKIIR